MKSFNKIFSTFGTVLFLVLLMPCASQAQSLAIIVHKDNPVETMSSAEVKIYWLRKVKKRWPTINKNIRPVDRKGKCSEQETFYKNIIKMSGNDIEAYFSQKQYESAEKPQDKFSNDNDIINFISEQEGAIGFINTKSISADVKSKVKIIATLD